METEHEHANINKAIITGICDRTNSMEEIAFMAGAKWAKRIERKSGGFAVETDDILLGFEGPIPDTVEFGLIPVRVRQYIPLPVRCIKCQSFGHRTDTCTSKVRCSRCGGDTTTRNALTGTKRRPCSA